MIYSQVSKNPDVFLVQVHFKNIGFGWTNCYVIVSDGDALIIDPGAPGKERCKDVLRALDDIGVNLNRTALFLTHLHLDHAGLVKRLFADAITVYLNKDDYRLSQREHAKLFAHDVYQRMLAEGVTTSEAEECKGHIGSYHYLDLSKHKITFVSEGDVISVGRQNFRVIGTAGHTPGHQSLYHEDAKIFFAGDHVLKVISPSIGLSPVDSNSYSTYMNNLQRVKDMNIRELFWAHGELSDEFDKRIVWLMGHHQQRLNMACSFIETHPGVTGKQVIESLEWNVPFARWDDISLLQRGLILMQGVAILDSLLADGLCVVDVDTYGMRHYKVAKAACGSVTFG